MIATAFIFLYATLGFILIQGVLVGVYNKTLRRAPEPGDKTDSEVAIILCVRGEDPSLESCLRSLVAQDYARKKIYVVGDHENDPGILVCRGVQEEFGDLVSIYINSEILQTCSVKCSNLISLIRQIESDVEFVVLVDGDTVPGSNWLQAMLGPFANQDTKVATGIRWFDVRGSLFGTWVRYIWNTAAIVQMVCYRIPWGGSLALRTSFIRDADVLDEWSRGFCEDTMLEKICRRTGGKVDVVPEAIIPSQEEITMQNCIPWISRQLLTARLHHPRWPLVLAHGIATASLTFGTFVLAIVSLASGYVSAAAWFAAGHLVLQLGNFFLLNWIESPVRQIRNSEVTFFRSPSIYLVAIFLTQISYVTAVFRTIFVANVDWRRVRYRIRGKKIELTEFAPFQQSGSSTESL